MDNYRHIPDMMWSEFIDANERMTDYILLNGKIVYQITYIYSESQNEFIDNLKMFRHVANVGDTRSLAIHPATTTHSQLDEEQLIAAGSPPELVRLSIGIEDIEDIIEDLTQALESTK